MLTLLKHPVFFGAIAALCLMPLPGMAQTTSTPPPGESAPLESISADEAASYILGPGDQIEITVFGYEEYTGAREILSDGTITLPVIGSVPAANRTTDQLAQELRARLQYYLVDPTVTVNLGAPRPVLVNVAGQVQRPGPIQLSNDQNNRESEVTLTLSSALIQAGGVTQNADIRQVMIRRALPDGGSSTSTINLWDALVSDNPAQNPILQDGDSIFVPSLAEGQTIDRRLIARSSLSPGTVRVRVVGEVKSPGEVQVPPDSSLSSAVAIAGGPTNDARLSRVAFVRMSETGQVERQTVDLENLTDNYQIQEGDVIIVPTRGSSSFLDFAERLSPIGALINVLGNLIGF